MSCIIAIVEERELGGACVWGGLHTALWTATLILNQVKQ